MSAVARCAILTLVGGVGWITVAWLIFVRDVGSEGAFSAAGISALFLFVGVPLITFLPLARRWDAPFYDVEAVIGWGGSAAVVAFVQPSTAPPTWQILEFLAPLTIACATLLTALAFCSARRVCRTGMPPSFVEARRRGYLGAICLIALGMLGGLGVLSLVITFLLVAICVLVEALILARWNGTSTQPMGAIGNERGVRSVRGS